jgi:hypothetical protein
MAGRKKPATNMYAGVKTISTSIREHYIFERSKHN